MENSFLPTLAQESLSVTKPCIILKDVPLQKPNFPIIYCQLSMSQHAQGEPQFITVLSQLSNFPHWKSWLRMLHCNFSCAVKGSFLKACKPERCLLPPQQSCPTGKNKYFILKGHKFRDFWQIKALKAPFWFPLPTSTFSFNMGRFPKEKTKTKIKIS